MPATSRSDQWEERPSVLVRLTWVLLVLASAALVGSVIVAARESARIAALLDEDRDVIEPARLAAGRLAAGLANEAAENEQRAVPGDRTTRQEWEIAADADRRRLANLRQLTARLDEAPADDVSLLGGLIERWRAGARTTPAGGASAAAADSAAAREAVRDSAYLVLARIQSLLATRSAVRRSAIRAHDQLGLQVNAALVVIALAALVVAVGALRRERRRMRGALMLSTTAETLSSADNVEEIWSVVADSAVRVFEARGAYVAVVDLPGDDRRAVVVATHGAGTPAVGDELPSDDSAVGRAIRHGSPLLLRTREHGKLIAIPLVLPRGREAAIVVIGASSRVPAAEHAPWAATLGHLATLAYEKVRLLVEARDGRSQLERAMQSRSRLMRGFSHDVKNPLGAADGYAALLADGVYGPLTEEQRVSIGRLRETIHRSLALIQDLHDLARDESGDLVLRPALTSIAELASALVDQYRASAAARRLSLSADVEDGVPEVETDPSRVREILGNLVTNAIKYTERGGITVRVRAERGDAGDIRHVCIDVVDTGPGIPDEQREIVFEEFVRLAPDRSPGAGLGLAISRRVADALGCRLRLESRVGHGCMFTLVMPPRMPRGQFADTTATVRRAGEPITDARRSVGDRTTYLAP